MMYLNTHRSGKPEEEEVSQPASQVEGVNERVHRTYRVQIAFVPK
jgi:hypothetical protein